MINRAKQRHIAYVFFTIAFIFVVLGFMKAQKEHSESNWYVTVDPGDKQKIFIFYPNIPYTIKSDDYILHYGIMTKKRNAVFLEEYSEDFGAPHGLEKILGGYNGSLCLKNYNITCKDTTYYTLTVQLSGFIYESGHYEIHKGKTEGRSVFFNNSKNKLSQVRDF
jgi:hypothetical protein